MSAAIYLRRREAAYLLTDAASYRRDGTMVSFDDKCIAIPELHCAFTTFGPANWTDLIAAECRARFRSYDDLLDGIAAFSRLLFYEHAATITVNPSTTCELWMMGWSAARAQVVAFELAMCSDAEWEKWQALAPGLERAPFRAEAFTVHIVANPVPTTQQIVEARLPSIADADEIDPELDLLHLMEIQRRVRFDGDCFCVGGYALLTRVDGGGVTQRRIHEWPEDCVGEKITPQPIEWFRWRAEREADKPLSKLKLDMLARRAAKAARRASA